MLRNSKTSFGWIAIGMHWGIAILLVCQFALGVTMVDVEDQRRAFDLIQLHKSLGFLLLCLIVLRLGWRLTNRFPVEPADLAVAFCHASRMSHGALYAIMLALPLTGWALVSASTLAIPTLVFGTLIVPDLPLTRLESAEGAWRATHEALGWLGVGLVGLHVGASIWHELTLGQPFLRRIWRPGHRH
ncbi:cytochrome b [Pararhizobium haloflavum]|uniref:cytochrome b n=1 Tax=Pararhizobium haloflavum TaxID=2037914 RepID=UPI000C1A0230|nr:cytochrome b [Pararhizobium haloflavum]